MIDLNEQYQCAAREIKMRERVYPRWVSQGRMTQQKANHEIDTMKAIRDTLKKLIDEADFELT